MSMTTQFAHKQIWKITFYWSVLCYFCIVNLFDELDKTAQKLVIVNV